MFRVDDKDVSLARSGKLALEKNAGTVEIVQPKGHQSRLELPRSAIKALIDALGFISTGQKFVVQPVNEEISTQKAAEMLKVSRPFLIKLLENGEMPFRRVGKHRRIAVSDIEQYKRQIDAKRLRVLNELTEQAQELGMGY